MTLGCGEVEDGGRTDWRTDQRLVLPSAGLAAGAASLPSSLTNILSPANCNQNLKYIVSGCN